MFPALLGVHLFSTGVGAQIKFEVKNASKLYGGAD